MKLNIVCAVRNLDRIYHGWLVCSIPALRLIDPGIVGPRDTVACRVSGTNIVILVFLIRDPLISVLVCVGGASGVDEKWRVRRLCRAQKRPGKASKAKR